MIDKKTLDDAFKTKEAAEELIEECKETIEEAAKPLVLSVLNIYAAEQFWPGRTPEEITKKVKELYDERFSEVDITKILAELNHEGTILGVRIGPRTGYRLKPLDEQPTIPYKGRVLLDHKK
ncbi:MAG: hypothetical protein ABIH63_00050 [archaeon]